MTCECIELSLTTNNVEFEINTSTLFVSIDSQVLDAPIISYQCDVIVSNFLASPDEEDYTQIDYFYFGWISVEGGWLVRRQLRADSTTEDATNANNVAYNDLTTAWPDRYSLDYA